MRLRAVAISVVVSVLVGTACRPASPIVTPIPATATREPANTTLTPTEHPTTFPEPTPVPLPVRAVLVALPGGCAHSLDGWTADGTMPAFAALSQQGVRSSIRGVDPTTSVVTHASLATGSYPAQTGITGERVHRPEDGFYWYTSAFDLPSSGADPIWAGVQHTDLTSAALFWPGAVPDADNLATYTVANGERAAYSNIHTLPLYSAGQWQDAPASFSPLLETQFTIEDLDNQPLATLYVLSIDSTDDSIINPDSYVLSLDRLLDAGDAALRQGEWAAFALDPLQGLGADFLITEITPNSLTLFHSGVYRLTAAPEQFRQRIIETFGLFAPAPDYYALEHDWIAEAQYLEMVRRQSEWMMNVTLWVDQETRPDLLMTVQYPLEQTAYQFLLADERQPGYSAARASLYEEYLAQGAGLVDHALAQLENQLHQEATQSRTALIVAGTTCLSPIHTEVNLNLALAQAGLLRLGRGGFVIVQSSKAIAFSSGGSAHVYINLSGREADGVVPPDQYEEVQAQVAETLSGLIDPLTGEPVLSRIVWSDELSEVQLDGSYAGDLFVQAKPGYYLNDDRRAGSVFEPVTFYGQQGYDSTLTDQSGILIASGLGLSLKDSERTVSLLDIAPSIAELLGIELPDSDGQSVLEWTAP